MRVGQSADQIATVQVAATSSRCHRLTRRQVDRVSLSVERYERCERSRSMEDRRRSEGDRRGGVRRGRRGKDDRHKRPWRDQRLIIMKGKERGCR